MTPKAGSYATQGITKRVSTPIYPKDILSDRELVTCSPAAKGAWLWTFLQLLADDKDRQRDTFEGFARSWCCTVAEAKGIVTELVERSPCDVSLQGDVVTLTSRRLKRKCNARKQGAARVRKHRAAKAKAEAAAATGEGVKRKSNGGCNGGGNTTNGALSVSVSVSDSVSNDNTPHTPGAAEGAFDEETRTRSLRELAILHQAPDLRPLTVEQWEACKAKRSPFLDWPKALIYLVTTAKVEGKVKKAGPFVDTRLGYFERDHREATARRRKAAETREAACQELAAFILEGGLNPDSVDRAKASAAKEYGPAFVDRAVDLAAAKETP